MKSLLLTSLTTVALFISCRNYQSEKAIDFTTADSTSVTGLSGDSVKLVKTAGIRFKVKDVYQSVKAVSKLSQDLGGIITHQNIESAEDQSKELKISNDSIMKVTAYTTYADITARVPSQHLEDFLYNVSNLGYFTYNSRMDIEDESLNYLSNQLKEQNRLQGLKNGKKEEVTNTQVIQTKDEAIDHEIAKRQIDADVKYSTVQLNLFQNTMVRKEMIANTVIEAYHLPFYKNLQNALIDGWQYFLSFIIALTHLWVFILLLLTSLLGYKYYRNKRKVMMANKPI